MRRLIETRLDTPAAQAPRTCANSCAIPSAIPKTAMMMMLSSGTLLAIASPEWGRVRGTAIIAPTAASVSRPCTVMPTGP